MFFLGISTYDQRIYSPIAWTTVSSLGDRALTQNLARGLPNGHIHSFHALRFAPGHLGCQGTSASSSNIDARSDLVLGMACTASRLLLNHPGGQFPSWHFIFGGGSDTNAILLAHHRSSIIRNSKEDKTASPPASTYGPLCSARRWCELMRGTLRPLEVNLYDPLLLCERSIIMSCMQHCRSRMKRLSCC